MCLAVPLKLITIDSSYMTGTVALSGGTLDVGLQLVPDARVGDFVLIHAGMAIERLEPGDARDILEACEGYVYRNESSG